MTVLSTLDLAPPPGRRLRVRGVLTSLGAAAATLALVATALGVGVAAALSPVLALAGVVGIALVVVVAWRPEFAAYLLIGATPLVVGIDRDRIVPMLRPNEALLGLLIAVLVTRAVLLMRVNTRPRIAIGSVALSLVAMAVASSILPIMFLVMRGRPVEGDDLTHAVVMWKTLAVFALVRYAVRTQTQVRVCLWISMGVAVVVGLLGIAQSLGLFGVRDLLVPWYASFGYTGDVESPRAGSTIGLPAATADFMILNLGFAIGMWWKDRRGALLLVPAALVFAMATFSAAEFSSALGLMVAVVTLAALLGRLDLLRYSVLAFPVVVAALWPTIEHRLADFQSMHGIPQSWLVRWYNLETYFWPQLFHGTNPIFGVRPSARVPADEAFGFVWIESGYTWLLWGGGIFLAGAFFYFVWVALRSMRDISRGLTSYSSVAALAAYAAVVVVVVLMIFDPHITYRGFADALYATLALALVAGVRNDNSPPTSTRDALEQEARR
jgi:hypothetical protein